MTDQLPVRRTILAVDVEGFSRPERDDPSRSDLRNALAKMLEAALLRCGVEPQATTRLDTGDGACVLLDPNVSEVTLLEECVAELGIGLKNYNRGRLPEAMLRLRMVLHSGHVAADDNGWSGQQLNITFRLLDAEPLREELRNIDGPLVLMVSDAIYSGVVQDGWRGLDPADWQQIELDVKGWHGCAWLYTQRRPQVGNRPIRKRTAVINGADKAIARPGCR